MKKSYLKGTASFMIALILTLPIYSSIVLAALSNGYIYGNTDGVKGYYRRSEIIYANITAFISGDNEISPSQVHLYDSNGPVFDSCISKGGGSFQCSQQMSSDSISESTYQLRVALYDDSGVFNSMSILQGAFDEQAPEIKSFAASPQIIGAGSVDFSYNVYDHSYSPTDSNRCSGIKKLELSHNGAIIKTIDINSPSNQCSASGTISVSLSEINPEEGSVEVALTAYDNFNYQSTSLVQFTYDPQPPIIDTGSLEIWNSNGDNIDYVGNSPVTGTIRFIVESEDLDPNNVYGDISEINSNNIPGYKNKKAVCVQFNEGYKCSFANIEARLSQSSNVHITVNSADIAGNTGTVILTKSIGYDVTGPSAKSIKTDKVDNDISYAGASADFTAILSEDGSGIDPSSIKLNLSEIKTGLTGKTADECSGSGNEWTCYWYNIITDEQDGGKKVYLSGSDKLGNAITGTLSSAVIVDRTPPVVSSSKVTPVGIGTESDAAGYIKTGDTLDIELDIKENNKLRAYADLSSLITTEDNIAGSCVKENDEDWTCDWSSSQIDVPGHLMGSLKFNVTDFSGNSIMHAKPIEVFNYDNAVNVSYWTSKVVCSPKLVDRQVTGMVNARVYCAVLLQPVTADQETLSMSLGSCTERSNNSLGYIENIQLMNAEASSTEPYLAIDLIKGEMSTDKLSITCPLQIISRAGTKINRNPEIEPVKIDIEFYNMPLGGYGNGIEKKIEDAKDDALKGIWKIIGLLKKLLSYAKLICHALSAMQKVSLIFKVFTEEVTTAHIAMIGTPVEPILGAEKTQACINDKTMRDLSGKSYIFLDKFCKFVNCQMSPTPPGESGTEKKGLFEGISNSLNSWTYSGNALLAKAPGGGAMASILSFGQVGGKEGTIKDYFGKEPYQYMNARDNLLVAIVLGCIPGIINGLEKYRQILCLYADCLEQNAYNNVPVKICEDQKSYAMCKYIFGEIFAILPWTALFDYYVGLVRSALSDPLTAIVTAINILGKVCTPVCTPDEAASIQWMKNEAACRALQFMSLLGEVINDVTGIIDEYKQIKNDYCARID